MMFQCALHKQAALTGSSRACFEQTIAVLSSHLAARRPSYVCLSVLKLMSLQILQDIQADRDAMVADASLSEHERARQVQQATGELYCKTGIAKIDGTNAHLNTLLEHGNLSTCGKYSLVAARSHSCIFSKNRKQTSRKTDIQNFAQLGKEVSIRISLGLRQCAMRAQDFKLLVYQKAMTLQALLSCL